MKRYLPNPVNDLMKASYTGQLSRRDVMKRGGALGLSATMMGTILASHNAAAQDASPAAEQPAGWSVVMPADLPDLAGVEISAMLAADGPGAPFDQAVCDMFAEATGAVVNYLPGAESATERLTFLQQTMAAQSADVDVAQIDVIWPGIFAAHAVDLSDQVGEVEFFERIQENNTVDGALVGLPWFTDAGLLYYRTDLLEKYGFEGPPVTWQELTDMATTIQEGEVAANSAFTGFTFQGGAYEGLTCNALEWQFSNGGGSIIEPDGTVSMNNDQAKAALELAASWVGTISPEAVTGYMEEDARGIWQGGNCAFMRNWPYAYVLSAADDSVIAGNFDITQLPMGDGEGAAHAACLGGWQMFVSRYSENQDAAKAFAKYMVSPELQKARAIERSALPTIGSLYEDEDILAANPFFGDLFDVFESGSVARPSTPSADLYGEVSLEYFTAVNEIMTGAAEVDARVEDLAAALEDIMADV
ncbi:MAG: ABC transporter substrate-binding protein [Chloroflexia bacterium]|nr:ABC transporter substrate-binding protein [Chloroflexia bacterium]